MITILLLTTVFLTGQQTERPNADRDRERERLLAVFEVALRNKQYDKAEATIALVESRDPKGETLHRARAIVDIEKKEYRSAWNHYLQVCYKPKQNIYASAVSVDIDGGAWYWFLTTQYGDPKLADAIRLETFHTVVYIPETNTRFDPSIVSKNKLAQMLAFLSARSCRCGRYYRARVYYEQLKTVDPNAKFIKEFDQVFANGYGTASDSKKWDDLIYPVVFDYRVYQKDTQKKKQ
jgi:hypothetical protein